MCRAAGADDARAIAALVESQFGQALPVEELEGAVVHHAGGRVVAAAVLGQARLPRYVLLRFVVVADGARGTGIGRALLGAVAAAVPDDTTAIVGVAPFDRSRFYQRCGFDVGERAVLHRADGRVELMAAGPGETILHGRLALVRSAAADLACLGGQMQHELDGGPV